MQISFLDTNQYSPSSWSDTPQNDLPNDQTGSQTCTCISETSHCSIHPSTPAAWIASMRDSLARISALPEMAAVLQVSEAVCGRRLSGALMQYDPASCSLKTAQQSFLEDSTEFYQTLPRWGSMHSGAVYPLQELVRPTDAIGGGALRGVPTASDWKGANLSGSGSASSRPLATMAAKSPTPASTDYKGSAKAGQWPTPTASDHKGGTDAIRKDTGKPRTDRLDHLIEPNSGGQLNPEWVEWLMGWPIGSTESRR